MTLLEREPLLDQLEQRLAAAVSGEGSLVLLAGEAGAGKTSVAREFARQAGKRALTLWGACDPLTTPRPLSPLLDVLADPESGLGDLSEHELEPLALFGTMLDRLRSTARPIILVIEDVHWADNGTLDFLRFLGRRVGNTKALVICTYRDDEVGPDHPLRSVLGELATQDSTHRLAVPSLSVEAVSELSRRGKGDAERLHALTDGNAFFVTEMIAAGEHLPMTVQDAVLARVARLGAGARRILEAVSIAPRELEIDLAKELAVASATEVDEATTAGMLLGQGEMLRFRHELARAAVEDAIPVARRLELHRRVIDLLVSQGSDDVARLTHHAARAQDGPRVAELAPLAAREAVRRGANREAAEFFQLALANASNLTSDSVAEIRLEVGRTYQTLDRQEEALAERELAARHYRLRGDDRGLGRALTHVSTGRWQLADTAGARASIDEAIGLLEPFGPSSDLATALYRSASLSMLARRRQLALDDGRRAMAMSQELGADAQLIFSNLLTLGTIEIVIGNPDEGVKLLKEARRLGEVEGSYLLIQNALSMLGSGGGEARYYDEALKALGEGIELGLRHDQDSTVAYERAWMGRVAFERGRWDEAILYAEQVMAGPPGASYISPVTALGAIGRVRVRRGDPAAREALEQALEIGTGGEMQHLWSPLCGLAELAWLEQRGGEIPAILDWVYGKALESDSRWARGEVGFWMWRAGAIDGPPENAAEPFALQMSGEWAEAAAGWHSIGCPYEEAFALADGDVESMLAALSIFDGLGAKPIGAWVRNRLRDLGVEKVPRGPRPTTRSSPIGLTPRQAEVLRLVCDGFDNSEIAQRLFISKKTAEHHVSAVMEKLGASTRANAIVRAGQLGLFQIGGEAPPT